MANGNNLEKSAMVLAYAFLVGVSYVLVKGICSEYMAGHTKFYSSKQPIAIEDNPAILVVFDTSEERIQFGVDYTVKLLHWNKDLEEYIQDPNEVIVYHDRSQGNSSGMTSHLSNSNKTEIDITRIFGRYPDLILLISPLKRTLVNQRAKFEFQFKTSTTMDKV